ncbi:MAG: hypothetical protein QMC81_04460 [Thermoanaerobacterales bacterium]|nr:hypothetical protein [Thermoanaerobacterales bacterium]
MPKKGNKAPAKSRGKAAKAQRRAARLRLVPVATPGEERRHKLACLRDLARWLTILRRGLYRRKGAPRR